MNGEFKTGLIGQMNLTNLNERLKQLDIEKKDIDGQYSVISTHSALDTTTKNKLVSAKGKLDSAHAQLVTKINAVIADNLLTSAELEEVNNLIVAYSTTLGEYSKVAQEANIAIAVNSAKNAVDAITDEDVFNKVTNFGKTQGLFIENGGKVYINAQYIQTRGFVAAKDDGTKTFEIDKDGNVNIIANSFTLTGQGNVATEDYVNSAIEGIVNKNISFSLSNEFQIIPTDATYYPFEEQSFVIQVYGYKGSEQTTDFTIGAVASTNAIKAVVSNVNHSVTFTVSPNTSLGTSHGYVDIPITCEGRPYNKRWSWSVAKQGDQAPQINITGEQVFRYNNNFTGTPTPASITLTANVYNTTVMGKWQYLQEESWVDCNVTSKTLSLQPTSYTLSTLKRVTVRYVVENVFDTFTVVAISDGANGNDGQDGINGQDGADGKGIASITEQYYHSTSMTTQAGGNWSTTVPTATRGKYIWTRSVIKYTDSTTTTTTPICVSGSDGVNGNNGANGTDGISVTSVDVEYAQNTSTTTAPTSGWTTTSPTWASGKYIWSRTKTTYSNGKTTYTNPACITGQKGDTGNSGADAITIVLTNENHTFSANSSGNITSTQSTTTNITAYKGSNTTSVTIGALPTVTGLTLSKSGSTITIQANTGTSLADTGTFSIPLAIDGKSFTKNFSWTKVKAGATGATGATGTSAKAVDIIASSQVFKSTDGGTTFSPSTITLTPKLQNLTYSNWQYSTNGGSSWTTVSSGSNGLTISSGVLTVSKSSPLYTTAITSIAFRVNTNDSAYYDVVTIVKLYDVADVDFDQIAQDKVDSYDKTLNQLKVFNKLTNNGQTQGIYLQDSKLYINGEYIKAGTITAEDITSGTFKGTNFIAGGSNSSGNIIVKDSSDRTTFQADRSGIYASRIDFETPSYKGDANVSVDYGGFHSIFERSIGGGGDATTKEGVLESRLTNTELFLRVDGHPDIIGYDTKTGETRITASEVSTWGAISGGSLQTDSQLKFLFGGGTDTANVWNQEQYNTTGNGQMLTYSAGRVFVSNPKTPLVLESSVTPSVKIGSDVEHQIFHTGYVPKSGNWWNGGAVRVSGDGVAEVGKYIDFHASNSSTSDYDMRLSVENDGGMRCTGSIRASGGFDCNGGYWIDGYQCVARAGHGGFDFGYTGANTAILSANVPTWWNGSVSQTIYTTGNKPSVIDPKGVMSNAEYGRNVYDSGIYTYNLHNNSLINGDSSWSAYAGYWSVLSWGRGTGGSAQLAVDWTAGGKGIYIRSLRDTQDNWWTWKRIPNDQWVQTSTSDIRYKEVMSDVDLDDCYSMVKNIGLHSYLLLDEEDRHTEGFDAELAFLQATQEEGISRKLQMGVIAQEMLDYKCADFVVVQDVLKGKDGEVLSDRYSIDAYNYASAILGGLQKEIQIRDEQYEELKQENKELKAKVDSLEQRLAKLEALLGQE